MQERKEEADRLLNLGSLQFADRMWNLRSQQFNKSIVAAIQSWQKALTIYCEIKDRFGESYALGSLGNAYNALGKYDKAIEFYLQRLAIEMEIRDNFSEKIDLNNLGRAFYSLGKYDKAIEFYLQRLANTRGNGDREDEGATLVALGKVYKKLGKNELAIDYYTRSVKVRESFRQDIRKFDKGAQQFYLNTISSDYKALADLLIQQGRNLEAQQILDLLKVN